MYRSGKLEVVYDYKDWLISLVDTPENDFRRYYTKLMNDLFDKDYPWMRGHNGDRFDDGIELRSRYDIYVRDGETHVIKTLSGKPCSILECLVALFNRYSDSVLTDPGDPSVAPELFYDALNGLELLFFDDSRYDFEAVNDILDQFLVYKKCMFSVKSVKKVTDLWLLTGKYSMEKWKIV